MQMLGINPYVLSSTEVLQDSDFLYSIMPFCRDGDLFGIVVKYAEDSGGEIGMPEPVARYWFRQILNVRDVHTYIYIYKHMKLYSIRCCFLLTPQSYLPI
jgi:serine/threonine protein kinase